MAARLVTSANKIELRDIVPGAQPQSTLTLSGGAVVPTRGAHVIAAESGTADDCDTITLTNLLAGDVIELTVDTGDTITFTTGVGNITTDTGAGIVATAGQTVRIKVNAAGAAVVASLIGASALATATINSAVLSVPASGVGGAGDAITVTVTGGPALADGMTLSFIPGAANTGAVTINYNAGGALALVDENDAALTAGVLKTTAPVIARYTSSGTKWRRVSGGGGTAARTPESFGAAGDGVTNDTAAMNLAVAYGSVIGTAGAVYLCDYLDAIDFPVNIDLSGSTTKLRSAVNDVSGTLFSFIAGAEGSKCNLGTLDGNKATLASTWVDLPASWGGWMGCTVECADVTVDADFQNFVGLAGYSKGDRFKGFWRIRDSGLGCRFGYDFENETPQAGYGGVDQHVTLIMDGINNNGEAFNQHGCDIWGAKGGTYIGTCRDMDGDTSGTSEWLSPFTVLWCENSRFDLNVIDCMPTANLRTNCVSAQTNRNCDFNIFADNFPGKGIEEVSNENCRFVVKSNGRDNVTWNGADTVGMNHDDNGWDADRSGHIITGGRGNTFTGVITGVTIGCKVQTGHPIYDNLHVIGAKEDGILIDKNTNAYFPGMSYATPSCTIKGGLFLNCGRAGIAIGDVDYVNIDGAQCNDNGQDTTQTSTERCGIAYVSSTNNGANDISITNTKMSDKQSYTVADGVSYNPGSTSSNKFTITFVKKPPSSRPSVGQWINLVGAASGPADISGRIVSISGDDVVIDCGASKTFVSTSNTASIGNGTASAGSTTVTGSGFDTSITGREWITDGVEWRQIAYVISDTQIKLEQGFTNALSGTALVKLTVDLEGIPSQQYGFFNTTSIKAMYLRGNEYNDNVLERMRAVGYGKLKAGSEYWYERKGLAPDAATYDLMTGGKKGHRLKYGRYQVTTLLTSSSGNFTDHDLRAATSAGSTLGNIITNIDGFSAATTIPKNSKTAFGPPSTSNSLEAWAQEDWKVQLVLGATPDGTGEVRFEALIEASDADWANV